MFPETIPKVAVIVVSPAATVVAKPLLSIVATDELEEVHVTCVVISWVVPSEYMPKAVNCPVMSAGSLEFLGVTDMAIRLAVDPPDAVLDPPESVPLPPPHPTKMRKSTRPSFNLIIHTP